MPRLMEKKGSKLRVLPTPGERQGVGATLNRVRSHNYTEIVVLGFKDGITSMHHSDIEDVNKLIGAVEVLKFRLMEEK